MQRVNIVMEKRYNCPICKKSFSSAQSKWNHKQRCSKRTYDDIVVSFHWKWKIIRKSKSADTTLERLNNRKKKEGGGFMESLLGQNKPEQETFGSKNDLQLKSDEEGEKFINSLPEESNGEHEHLGKRLKKLFLRKGWKSK